MASNITILPAQVADYETLALVEAAAFEGNEFGPVAFGPPSETAIHNRAKTLADSHTPGEVARIVKAVMIEADGKEEVVGLACWRRFTGADVFETEEEEGKETGRPLTGMACPELFVDVIVRGEELMKKSVGEKDYLSEFC